MLALVCLDTAPRSLLDRLVADGSLPTLAELAGAGAWQALDRPSVDIEAGGYQTLYAGVGLEQHGLYYPFQWSASEQRLRHIHSFPAPQALWERLSLAGRESLVVDPYEGRPPDVARGVHLSGWQFVNRFVLPRWSSPAVLGSALARRFGRPPLVEEVFGRPSLRTLAALRPRLLTAPARAADAACRLLARHRFDLVWIHFPALHVAGHRLWDLSQLGAAEAAEGRRLGLDSTLADVSREVDAAMGRVVSALPAGADLIVFSASGMAPNTSAADLLPDMVAAVLDGVRPAARGTSIWGLRAAVPASARGLVARPLPTRLLHELAGRLETRGLEWSRTRAFCLPSDEQGLVRLNIRGRERDGIVDPAERDALVEELTDGLMSFEGHDGEAAVDRVLRVDDIVPSGPGLERLPDLVVRWTDRRLDRLRSPQFGEVSRRGGGSGRTGNHTAEAWALVLPGASRACATERRPHLHDLAATACSLLGADTNGLAGEPLLERG